MTDIAPNCIVELLASVDTQGRIYHAGSTHRVWQVADGKAQLIDDVGRRTISDCPVEKLRRLTESN